MVEIFRKILVLFAHPSLHTSKVNRLMKDAVEDLDHVTVHDLYQMYPEFYIDVDYEQMLLRESDLIVFHHPFQWYSSPAILKEWQDRVLEYGFAYGQNGTALQGKDFMAAISTRGTAAAYTPQGYNKFSIDELLRPYQATANLCGMHYRKPTLLQGVQSIDIREVEAHAQKYRQLLIDYGRSGAAIFDDRR